MNDRQLLGTGLLILFAAILLVLSVPAKSLYPNPDEVDPERNARSPGHYLGLLGTAFLLVPVAYSAVKRTEREEKVLVERHILFGFLGLGLIIIHSHQRLTEPPVLILLSLLGVTITGTIGRFYLSRLARAFNSPAPFLTPGPVTEGRGELAAVIEDRRHLLEGRGRTEGEYSTHALREWLLNPTVTYRAYRLGRKERAEVERMKGRIEGLMAGGEPRFMGPEPLSSPTSALFGVWRPLHYILAAIMLLGAVIHTLVVLYFPWVTKLGWLGLSRYFGG